MNYEKISFLTMPDVIYLSFLLYQCISLRNELINLGRYVKLQ